MLDEGKLAKSRGMGVALGKGHGKGVSLGEGGREGGTERGRAGPRMM